ncbi:PREDICTED: uncharacterized protein LOC107355998 [Acropora digitifera]|uniref:uncharacterized protein LOC107355998 n=1 Tax=Acropora digitifera TaxID=70779 RepID=UPI00077AA02C|nr:PREDICTED: uncharacterized protein LOC107355998 [Acropora digitifera]
MRNCQCLSFNFYESSNKTSNCELNEANTKIVPDALTAKEGVTYFEPLRKYDDPEKEESAQVPCLEQQCNNHCCATTPCQHGGTCYEVCDLKKRRFKCTCTSGYTGHRCQLQGTQLQSHLMQEPLYISLPMEDPPYHSPPVLAPAP